MLNPILRMPGRFQHRAQRGERVGRPDLVRREPGREQPGAIAGLLVAERNIAGIVGRERERNAAHLGLHRIDRVRLGLDRDMALIMHPRDQGVERVEAADGLVLVAIDRKLARGLGTRRGERNRSAFEACGLVLLARCAPSPCPVHSLPRLRGRVGWGMCPRDRLRVGPPSLTLPHKGGGNGGSGGSSSATAFIPVIRLHIGRIDLRVVGDAAGQGGKFHRFQERDQLARIGLVDGKLVERHVECNLVVEQHQLARNAGLLRILDQRLAALRLLDLAGAQQQRLEVAIFDDQLRGGLDADPGHTRHVVG